MGVKFFKVWYRKIKLILKGTTLINLVSQLSIFLPSVFLQNYLLIQGIDMWSFEILLEEMA